MQVMLAHQFDKYRHRLIYPVAVQPKLDGIRAIYSNGRFISRNGKDILGVPNLLYKLKKNGLSSLGDLDGELYSKSLTFQEIASIVRCSSSLKDSSQIEYWVFDYISSKNYEYRYDKLKTAYTYDSKIRIIPQEIAYNESQVEKLFNLAIENGFEGVIVRSLLSGYEFRRSPHLLKLKPTKEAEAICLGAVEGEGKFKNSLGALQCIMGKKTFYVGSGFTDEQRKSLWENPPLNKLVTFKYQSETDGGIPRFPVFKEIRDYE